jgi:protein-S-isoprenylcysteine O-methyltransferase Ste14
MSITGIGRKLFAVTALYSALVVYLHFKFYPFFSIQVSWVWFIGVILMISGAVLIFRSIRELFSAISRDDLATDGPFAVFLNPIYASWILLILPGISLFIYSWLMLTASIVMYIALRVFIVREEEYLREKFGSKYEDYRGKVLCKFL